MPNRVQPSLQKHSQIDEHRGNSKNKKMTFDDWHQDQACELRSSLAPCSLDSRIRGSKLSSRASRPILKAATGGGFLSKNIPKSMKFNGIHENQPRELRSSLAPCSWHASKPRNLRDWSLQCFYWRSPPEASAYKSGRGFQEETLQAIRLRPRRWK